MTVYSSEIKDQVRKIRKLGLSLNEIQSKFKVPRTTIRGWIKDISLSEEQKEKFRTRTIEKLQQGRIKTQKLQKEKRINNEKSNFQKGVNDIDMLTKRERFLVGVALYWAEGFKNRHEHRLGFCNSDPLMILFYIKWLNSLGIKNEDITLCLALNISYKNQVKEVEKYWSELLEIPLDQFTKPFFQKSIWKKQFNTDIYKGVLRVHVKDSLDLLLKMRGWIEGLKMIK